MDEKAGLNFDRSALTFRLAQDWLAGAEDGAGQRVGNPKGWKAGAAVIGLFAGSEDNLLGSWLCQVDTGLLGVCQEGGRLDHSFQDLIQASQTCNYAPDFAQNADFLSPPFRLLLRGMQFLG